MRTLLSGSQRRAPEVSFGEIASDVSEARFWITSGLPTIRLKSLANQSKGPHGTNVREHWSESYGVVAARIQGV